MSDNTLYCAFCKKNQRQVATLIAGPAHRGEGLFVCDECVDMLAGIVAEKRGAATRDIARASCVVTESEGIPKSARV
jgi:ATP-dependent protease Clp ATPase subunit